MTQGLYAAAEMRYFVFGLIAFFLCSKTECVIRSVIIDEVIDADMEFYKANIGDEDSHTMLIKLDGEGLVLENVTIHPYNNWLRESSGGRDHALLSLDTRTKTYSFDYKVSINDFTAVFGALKLPSWPKVRHNVTVHFDKATFRFGPMIRTFLPDSMCNSSLSITLLNAKGNIGNQDVSSIFSTTIARAFERKSKALCNIVNPHQCTKILTPLMYGHF